MAAPSLFEWAAPASGPLVACRPWGRVPGSERAGAAGESGHTHRPLQQLEAVCVFAGRPLFAPPGGPSRSPGRRGPRKIVHAKNQFCRPRRTLQQPCSNIASPPARSLGLSEAARGPSAFG